MTRAETLTINGGLNQVYPVPLYPVPPGGWAQSQDRKLSIEGTEGVDWGPQRDAYQVDPKQVIQKECPLPRPKVMEQPASKPPKGRLQPGVQIPSKRVPKRKLS